MFSRDIVSHRTWRERKGLVYVFTNGAKGIAFLNNVTVTSNAYKSRLSFSFQDVISEDM